MQWIVVVATICVYVEIYWTEMLHTVFLFHASFFVENPGKPKTKFYVSLSIELGNVSTSGIQIYTHTKQGG